MGEGGKMQRGIGRAAGRGDDRRSILQRFPRDDIAWADVAGNQVHDLLAGRHAKPVPDLVGCGRACGVRPIASDTQAIVLAVNWAPQAPAEGQATCSSVSRSSADIVPTEYWPTASNRSCTVTGLPLNEPGRIEPP